jgi:hypothetical protein
MDLDKDNANPTILNASDLPSRRREAPVSRRADGGTGLFDDLIPPYNHLNDPLDHAVSSSDSDDDAVEHIDEQEVYGTSYGTCSHTQTPRHATNVSRPAWLICLHCMADMFALQTSSPPYQTLSIRCPLALSPS